MALTFGTRQRNAPLSEGNQVQTPGHHTNLAVTDAHDDDNDTTDPAMLAQAINHALNGNLLEHDLGRKTAAAAKTHDFVCLEVISARCDQNIDNLPHAFTYSSSLTALVSKILHSLRTISTCNVVRVILKGPTLNICLCLPSWTYVCVIIFYLLFRVLWPTPFSWGRHGKSGIHWLPWHVLEPFLLKRSLSFHCLFAINLNLFQSNVHSMSCRCSRPAYAAQGFPTCKTGCIQWQMENKSSHIGNNTRLHASSG